MMNNSTKGFLLLLFMLIIGGNTRTAAQALLPDVNYTIREGQTYITFRNGFGNVSQIGVQRSRDSLRNFYTIGYVGDPGRFTNAFLDSKPMYGANFYRLFLLFKTGKFFFSKTFKVTIDSVATPVPVAATKPVEKTNEVEVFKPSTYVFTNAKGNINIHLPDADKKKYSLKFFEATGEEIFDIKKIKQPTLILDKSNFLHGGWFHFELYEDGKLKEKWKFFLPSTLRYKP